MFARVQDLVGNATLQNRHQPFFMGILQVKDAQQPFHVVGIIDVEGIHPRLTRKLTQFVGVQVLNWFAQSGQLRNLDFWGFIVVLHPRIPENQYLRQAT